MSRKRLPESHHREYHRNYMKKRRDSGRVDNAAANERCKQNHLRKRIWVLDHYGGRCECCGEDRLELLTIHHKNGDGGEQRKRDRKQASNFYHWIINNGFPADLCCMCMNCHHSLHRYGYCPHDRERGTYDLMGLVGYREDV